MMKKMLAQLLAVVMLLSLVPLGAVESITAFAATSGGFEYTVVDNEVIITDYTGTATDLIIPVKLGGKLVTRIDDVAFSECTSLETVTILSPLFRIGDWAFAGCTSLKSITISECKLIGTLAFYGCDSLTSITIPADVIQIEDDSFSYCNSLKNITVDEQNTMFSSIDGVLFDKNKTVLLRYPLGREETSYTIPNGVTTIETWAFEGCSLTDLVIPDSVIKINYHSFSRCDSLTSVYYSGSLEKRQNMDIAESEEELLNAMWQYDWCIENDVHEFSDATCTEAAICQYCGTTNKAALGHQYTNDCDTSCNVCEASRSIKHTYKNTITPATLSTNGSVVKRCSECNKLASKYTIKYAKIFKLSATSYTYDGKAKSPTVTVKDSAGKTLKKGTDYTVTYASGRKNAGTYKVTVKMIGKYSGTKTLSFKIDPVKIAKCKLKLSADVYTYNGTAKTPSVVVKNAGGKTLKKGTDYTVTYASGRKNVGTYKVTVKMKGNYTGSKTLTFKINPPKTTVSKLTAGKKAITVAITKKTKEVSGYQIQYSTSKSFTNATTKTISSYKTTTYELKSLKAAKTYYVRVRTYKTVNGKKVYSDWSAAKSVKTKA